MPESPRRDASTDRHGRSFWEWWTTRVAVIGVLITVVGGGVYASVDSVPGYAPWQDKASTLMRQVGLGTALDVYENWLYGRHLPSDTPPDVRGLMAAMGGSTGPIRAYSFLPALPVTADGPGHFK